MNELDPMLYMICLYASPPKKKESSKFATFGVLRGVTQSHVQVNGTQYSPIVQASVSCILNLESYPLAASDWGLLFNKGKLLV